MSQQLLVRFCLFFAVINLVSNDAWALDRHTRVIFQGCNGYFAAAGEARFHEVRFEKKQKDREELEIEIKNVPMTPGTTLMVYVDDAEVGKIVLDKKRSGVLKVTSDSHNHVPVIEPGTMVQVRTTQGRTVMK